MDTRQVNTIIENACKNISAMEPGTTIAHLVLEEMLEVHRLNDKEKYYNRVGKLRNELRNNYGIFLRTETKIGYSVSRRGKEIDLCLGKVRAGINKIRRGTLDAQYIRVDLIPDERERQRAITESQKMASILGMVKMGQPQEKERLLSGT